MKERSVKINDLDAYFVGDRMFACISGDGVGLHPPAGRNANSNAKGDRID